MSEAKPVLLRPAQEQILAYRAGRMGISAVPGSGKTWTLSHLAASIITRGELADDQEVLVVTLVNSSVNNFYQRVSRFITSQGLFPNLGYRVRTLHGLAHDIVRERPTLVGLAENFTIVDERDSDRILSEAVQAWLNSHLNDLDDYLDPELNENRLETLRSDPQLLLKLVKDMAAGLIRQAKDQRLSPERLRAQLDSLPVTLPLAEMGAAIYADYQRGLAYRGAVDFDDLIRLALQALESDQDYLERLRYRWKYVLEDEAQDSSRLQEQILEALVGPHGNWVRVGDPNQAIYETFTTANPKYLREFLQRDQVVSRNLPNSGRSTHSIITLANFLVDWCMYKHPLEAARDALHAPPYIEPAPEGDPQPNPPDAPRQVHLYEDKLTAEEEIDLIVRSVKRWLEDHPDETVAILAPRNDRCFKVVDELREKQIPYEDSLLRSSSVTRFSAGALANLLNCLANPASALRLSTAYRVWRRADRGDDAARRTAERIAERLQRLACVEDYLWPAASRDWLAALEISGEDPEAVEQLGEFRSLMRRWQSAVLLPIDQLVLTLAQDLLTNPTELAIAHKLAILLRQASQAHPTWRLPELTGELAVIAKNERRYLGFSDDDMGFDPEKYKGKVVVATVHKAKGLEWDRVYLMSVSTYDFPSGEQNDTYISEKWFVRGKLNLEAEARAQLEAALSDDPYSWYQEGEATQQARLDYIRERLRLLYVGITRARRELVITWNSGRRGIAQPATPLVILQNFWNKQLGEIEQA
jgi:DNA helicase-2/ATP-dependent DNA helicase PcrA